MKALPQISEAEFQVMKIVWGACACQHEPGNGISDPDYQMES